jgi:SSS family solute:Na+ symporter
MAVDHTVIVELPMGARVLAKGSAGKRGEGHDVVGLMATHGILADEPVYYGLLSSLAAYLAVSLMTKPTDAAVLAAWRERLAGRDLELVSEPVPAHQ